MTYEEYGTSWLYQNKYRNTELLCAVRKEVASMSIEEVREYITEYSLDNEDEKCDLKVLSGSEKELREFLFEDKKHLTQATPDVEIDEYITEYG